MKDYEAREQIKINDEWVTFSKSKFVGTSGEVVEGSMFVNTKSKRGLVMYKGEVREFIEDKK